MFSKIANTKNNTYINYEQLDVKWLESIKKWYKYYFNVEIKYMLTEQVSALHPGDKIRLHGDAIRRYDGTEYTDAVVNYPPTIDYLGTTWVCYTIAFPDGTAISSWCHPTQCELLDDKVSVAKKCDCPIVKLMTSGCSCGGS